MATTPAKSSTATEPSARATGLTPEDRPVDLRLARLHLRTGALALARAEFESFAGAGTLDDDALLDLAEVRWRTGDLAGAGEVANAYLAGGRDDPLALVIAAEATAALGRPGEARRLADRALEATDQPLDRLFAGMPRNAIWPHDPADPGEMAGLLFPGPTLGDVPPRRRPAGGPPAVEPSTAQTPSLWEGHAHDDAGHVQRLPDPGAHLDAARAALSVGDGRRGALHLAVVLRAAPALAPAVLDALTGAGGADVEIVRGDAYRLVGHELEARRAFADAAGALAPALETDANALPDAPPDKEES